MTDHLGNTRVVVSGQGEVVQRNDYYAFGLAIDAVDRTVNKYTYNGKELQPETGLLDYGARQYDGAVGRWFSIDPLADEPVQLDKSPYAYGWNNPIKYTDPDGQCPDCPENDRTSHGQLQRAFLGHENDIGNSLIDLGKKILSYTDFNDATVIATNITRGGNAINLDGTSASTFDKVSAHLGAALPVVSGSAVKKGVEFVGERAFGAWKALTGKYEQAHHIIQDAAVRNIPGYKYRDAPNVHLKGKANVIGTEHNIATQTQNKTIGGGTYGAERRIAYRALRNAGVSRNDAKIFVREADKYFMGKLNMTLSTPTNYPKTRVKR